MEIVSPSPSVELPVLLDEVVLPAVELVVDEVVDELVVAIDHEGIQYPYPPAVVEPALLDHHAVVVVELVVEPAVVVDDVVLPQLVDHHGVDDVQAIPRAATALHVFIRPAPSRPLVNEVESGIGSAVWVMIWSGSVAP